MSAKNEHTPFIMLDPAEGPLYRQVYASIRRAILGGEFLPGQKLRSSRVLAEELGVSRITIVNAYDQLFAEGYLEGRTGAGTFVAAQLPEDLLQIASETLPGREKTKVISAESLSEFGRTMARKSADRIRNELVANFRPFQNGLTAVEEFPFDLWARIASKKQRNPLRSLLGYGDPQGYRPLREAIAAHLASSRGVICSPEQVVVTSGAQQALDLIARVFISPGDAAMIEDPCYLEARGVFEGAGATVVPVPVDGEGIDISRAPKNRAAAKLVYVTPSHQYPLGVTMSLARRLELIEWANGNGAWIIEDDYNSEFRYAGRPLASLQGLDPTGRVIYVGTFSKTIFPALRIGCLVLPEKLVDIFTAARALNDVHSSLIDQAVLADFISGGHFARHLRRMRTLYANRQKLLLAECRKHLAGFLDVEPADAGMHLVGWLPAGRSDAELSEKAAAHGLKLSPISSYYAAKPERTGFILGYTAFDGKETRAAVKKIGKLLSGDI